MLLLICYGIQKTKENIVRKRGFIVFYSKKYFCIMNKAKLVWFYSLYRNYFLSKSVIFLYILLIFFTMLHLKIFLEYWIIPYIFRISLCVTSPLHQLLIFFSPTTVKQCQMWTERWWGFSEHFSTNIDFINTFFASDYYFNPRWFIIKADKFCITSGNLP